MPIELRTERLTLRPPRASDRAWLYELQTNNLARAFLGGARHDQAAKRAVEGQIQAAGRVFIAARDGAEPVGVLELAETAGDIEVSYVFDPAEWGQGYAAEALDALLPWVALNHGVSSVIAVTQAANTRSLRLLERLGFLEEARFWKYGEVQVQLRWTATKPD